MARDRIRGPAPALTRAVLLVVGIAACGSRTGLLVPDGVAEAGLDAAPDVSPDVSPDECPDAGLTRVYVVTSYPYLYSFDPTTNGFTMVGFLQCPTHQTALSMAVDRRGIAQVVFQDGQLFRVDTATAECEATPWGPRPFGTPFSRFGMAYTSDDTGGGETLYVASGRPTGMVSTLASIDTSYGLHPVAAFAPTLHEPELAGTRDGRLFAFDAVPLASESSLLEIDKHTARVESTTRLPGVVQGRGWAFVSWGGDFFFFTDPSDTGSIVQRYRPSDGSIVQVASLQDKIVGAGVSTCAP